MKKLLLALIVLFNLHATVNAQSIEIYDRTGTNAISGDTLTFWYPDDPNVTEGVFDFDGTNFARVVNEGNDTITIKLKRVVHSFINASEDFACWGSNCYGPVNPATTPVWDVNDLVVTNPGDTAAGLAPLQLYLDFNDNTGLAVYDYVFYDVDNPVDSAVLHVKWVVTLLTDVNEIANAVQKMEVYPNPAVNQFTVDLNAGIQADNQEIIIRDMLGKTIKSERINSRQEKFIFSTEGMTGGIYFVSYMLDGEVLKTSKLVVR